MPVPGRDARARLRADARRVLARNAGQALGSRGAPYDVHVTTARPALRHSPRRRDRRGRGLRGLLYPTSLPATRTRAEKFDAMVLEALEPIELRWGSEPSDLDLAVDEVPEVVETSPDEVVWGAGVLADIGVPLAQLVPAARPDGQRSAPASCLPTAAGEPRPRLRRPGRPADEVLVEQVAEPEH